MGGYYGEVFHRDHSENLEWNGMLSGADSTVAGVVRTNGQNILRFIQLSYICSLLQVSSLTSQWWGVWASDLYSRAEVVLQSCFEFDRSCLWILFQSLHMIPAFLNYLTKGARRPSKLRRTYSGWIGNEINLDWKLLLFMIDSTRFGRDK